MELSSAILSARIDALMLRDRQRLIRRLQAVKKISHPVEKQSAVMLLEKDIVSAHQRMVSRQQRCPRLSYPDNLPVSAKKQAILDAINKNQVVIVAGETGSGKSTQLPKICLEAGRGIRGVIGHTQPRRVAARALAARITEELNGSNCIGCKVRFADNTGENTLVKLMTDGILLAEIRQDRQLMHYDTLIIDEAHERSLNIDFILGYLHQLLPQRPDLKVIVTSATLDHQRFSHYFNQAPVIEVCGTTWPVEVRFRPRVDDDAQHCQLQSIIDAVDELSHEGQGDILIFMSGEREIQDAAEVLNAQKLAHTEVLPLYARLPASEQNRIFQPHVGRRIILATNVAETSLTVPGIRYVIDTGTARISRYNFRTKVQSLPIEPVSKASADQRKGRCGRISAGICIRLYDEADFLTRPEFTDPEIVRTSLAAVILQMTAIGLGDIRSFPFISPPDKRSIQDGLRLLHELRALDIDSKGHHHLTACGHQLAQLPLDPRLACMMLTAGKMGALREVMIIAAALSIQDPRERPPDRQQAADERHRRFADKDSDFLSLVKLWDYLQEQQAVLSSAQLRKLYRSDFLSWSRLREWQDIHAQLSVVAAELGMQVNQSAADYRSLHQALLSGLLSHIGQKDIDRNEFTGASNRRFVLTPGSALSKKPPKWVMVAELIETRRLWGRIAARIDAEWVESLAPHLVKRHYSEPHWEKSRGAVVASEKVTLSGLTIVPARKCNYSAIDPVLCRELFIRHALVEGDWETGHAFFHANLALLADVDVLEHKSRRRDIRVDDQTLFDFYDQHIPQDVVSARHFDSWWKETGRACPDLLNFSPPMLVKADATQITTQQYPDWWQQGDLRLRLSWQFEPGTDADGVTVHIPLVVLGQIRMAEFDWQVPALRLQLVTALIKSLPKPLRRHFVPAPDYATAVLNRVTPLKVSLLDALETELKGITGVTVSRESWCWEQVPEHLKMTFRIIDDEQHTLAQGKNLAVLRESLKAQVHQALSATADNLERNNLRSWDFATLPVSCIQQRVGYSVTLWPALVDEGSHVAIRLFDTEQQQQRMMRQGTRRLLWLNMPSPVKYLHDRLSDKSRLALYFHPCGRVVDLIDDCIACAIDELMTCHGGPVWQQPDFIRLLDAVRAGLNDRVMDIVRRVEQILITLAGLHRRLKEKVAALPAGAVEDITRQLANLVYPGFVARHGLRHLSDTPRYLQAIEKRIEKLALDPARDNTLMLSIQRLQQMWQQWLDKKPAGYTPDVREEEIRWMIEELRVSLFAQQLGTAYPVSEKRILTALARLS